MIVSSLRYENINKIVTFYFYFVIYGQVNNVKPTL